LWYNGDANGAGAYNNTYYIQQQIVHNDFNVTGSGWNIDRVWSNDIFGFVPPPITPASWEIWSNIMPPTGKTVVASDLNALATLTPTGRTVLGSAEYTVEVSGLNVALAPGTYWLAVTPISGNGPTAITTTSGANAVGTPPGNNGNMFLSYSGGTLIAYGPPGIDTSAGVAGTEIQASSTPEPASLFLLGGMGAAGFLARAWRRRKL
jgi:hypothetical protein